MSDCDNEFWVERRDKIKAMIIVYEDAMLAFGEEAKKGMNPIMDGLSSEIDQRIELQPLIAPVMDLSNVTAGAGLIRDAFGRVSIPAELTNIGKREDRLDNDETDDGEGSNGVVYNQYNYSPKALDRDTIYRLTKTQIARLSAAGNP